MSWQAVVYFLIWAGFFTVMMRFGCGSHVMGHSHKSGAENAKGTSMVGGPSAIVPGEVESTTDPICGMKVSLSSAKTSVYDGHPYYFCSATCRDKFEAAPAKFIKAGAADTASKEHHHGCC